MRSVALRRFFGIILITVLLSTAAMILGYMFLSSREYVSLRVSELKPKVDELAQMAYELKLDNIDEDAFYRLTERLVSDYDTCAFITDDTGDIKYLTKTELKDGDIETALNFGITQALSGSFYRSNKLKISSTSVFAVGTPIITLDGTIHGTAFIVKRSDTLEAAIYNVNSPIIITCLSVIPLVLIITFFNIKKTSAPIMKMADVAIAMSRGNFDARADEHAPGEVGLLARAMNTLCETLSKTIYQLRAEKGQLDLTLASLNDGVAAIDELGLLTHYNPALMRMFGAVSVNRREDLIPQSEIWMLFDKVFISGVSETITYVLNDKTLWITASPVFTEDNECTGVVGLFKDMSEMERTERMRREYIANISHELRTPLTAVRGLLEPLSDGLVTDENDRQRYYKIMLHEVIRLSRLITDMLTLSRLQSGTEYMELSRVNLTEVITDLAEGYAHTAKEKGISLLVDAREKLIVMTDPDRLEQLLVILIDNALNYTHKDGTVTVRTIPPSKKDDSIRVSVCDTGIGISKNDIDHVFERFYKADKARTTGGTGLGLSIAQRIIEALGETITVESEVGHGTCFTFTLKRFVENAIPIGPVTIESAKPVSQETNIKISDPGESSERKNVLDAEYEEIK
ncbi:MAG: ATP-binding protein [Clostridia bacterium]